MAETAKVKQWPPDPHQFAARRDAVETARVMEAITGQPCEVVSECSNLHTIMRQVSDQRWEVA